MQGGMEMLKQLLQDTKKGMKEAEAALGRRYATMRGGRARPEMVNAIRADCYGSKIPLQQLATISVPEPRLIVIEPWDKSLIQAVKKALMASDLSITPTDDGNLIRLAVPPLTEERRGELARMVKQWAEEVRVSLRHLRRDARETVEKMEADKELSEDEKHRYFKEIQSLTDEFMGRVNEAQDAKVDEILTV